MKKILLGIGVALVLALTGAAVYLTRPVDVFGADARIGSTQLVVDPENITSFQALEETLEKFPFLKAADLGSYPVDQEQAKELRASFPNVDFTYCLYLEICGASFPADSVNLDLSGVKVTSMEELTGDLSAFGQVKTVTLGDNLLTEDEDAALRSAFPDVEFDTVVVYNICGKSVRSDAASIDLTDTTPDENLVSQLSVFPNLTYVDLHGVSLTYDEMLELGERYPNVEFGMVAELGGVEVDTNSESIDLNNQTITDLDEFERQLKLFPKVTRIEMCDCSISNEDMADLNDRYPDIQFVWRVHMGQWSLKTDAVAFSVLIYNYKHKRLTSEDIEVLKYCPDLQALDLGHQALTDLSCIPEYTPELRVLILADNRISDLTPLAQLKHLHYLEFFVNKVTDLTPLAQCKELVDLNISYNYGISNIEPLLDLPLLERLWLESVAVSAADVQRLRDTYPNATIISRGSGSVDQGWRTHERYYAMIDMYHNDYISESFSKYDDLTEPPAA